MEVASCNIDRETDHLHDLHASHESQQRILPCSGLLRGVKMVREPTFRDYLSAILNSQRLNGSEVKIFGGVCVLSFIYSYAVFMWVTVQYVVVICFVCLLCSNYSFCVCFALHFVCSVFLYCFVCCFSSCT